MKRHTWIEYTFRLWETSTCFILYKLLKTNSVNIWSWQFIWHSYCNARIRNQPEYWAVQCIVMNYFRTSKTYFFRQRVIIIIFFFSNPTIFTHGLNGIATYSSLWYVSNFKAIINALTLRSFQDCFLDLQCCCTFTSNFNFIRSHECNFLITR